MVAATLDAPRPRKVRIFVNYLEGVALQERVALGVSTEKDYGRPDPPRTLISG